MTLEQLRAEISRLPLGDRLLLVEDTWDSIAKNPADVPMQDWQVRELDSRYKEYEQGKSELQDWQSVHERIRDKHK